MAICDYPFIGGEKSYFGLASKKGIALTVGIGAAIIGSSFLIWYMPQSNQGAFIDAPRTDGEVIGDIYSRHNVTATEIAVIFEQWKSSDPGAGDVAARLDTAKSQIAEMRQQLDNRQPAQEWQESYDIYMQALDAYGAYLEVLEQKVDVGDKTDPDPKLTREWQDLVDESVSAMPLND